MTNNQLDAEFRLAQRKVNMVVDNIYWEAKERWQLEYWFGIFSQTGNMVFSDDEVYNPPDPRKINREEYEC